MLEQTQKVQQENGGDLGSSKAFFNFITDLVKLRGNSILIDYEIKTWFCLKVGAANKEGS